MKREMDEELFLLVWVLKKQIVYEQALDCHSVGGVLGDGLGTLGDGVLGELTGEEEADGGLHLSGGEGGLLVVADELGRLGGDLLEDVVDEGVHDGHGSLGDAGIGVHLLEDSVDVDGEGFDSLLLGGSGGFLGGGLGGGSGHLNNYKSLRPPLNLNQGPIQIWYSALISQNLVI